MRFLLLLLFPALLDAQTGVVTAFPSLRIPWHSRGLGMGDMGIASASENQQLYYNAAKTAFTHHFHQATFNYTPWMNSISDQTRLMNVNYLASMGNTSALGFALNYLDYGMITNRDNNGATINTYRPREYSLGVSYALQMGGNASIGVTMRMLGQHVYNDLPRSLFTACGDVGYYQFIELPGENGKIEWGIHVSNLGPKVRLPGSTGKTALPLTAGIGIGYVAVDEGGNEFSAGVDVNKTAAPSLVRDWKAMRLSGGVEYGFQGSFFLRGGASLEHKAYGNRKFFSLGVGYKGFVFDQSWGVDFHYLVPFGTLSALSPFENCLGLTLKVNFGNFQ